MNGNGTMDPGEGPIERGTGGTTTNDWSSGYDEASDLLNKFIPLPASPFVGV